MRLKGTRLQSAMEYLMTYGWAILAIAIVMVSLYSLGIFNTGSLQPAATPGSCEVVRTAAQTSLAGQCTNMIPKYVAKFSGNAGIKTTGIPIPNTSTAFTVSFWVNPITINSSVHELIGENNCSGALNCGIFVVDLRSSGSVYCGAVGGNNTNTGSYLLSTNHWYNIVCTYNSRTATIYINTTLKSSATPVDLEYPAVPFVIGRTNTNSESFNGYLSNVQVYNKTLDTTEMKAIYLSGIGGIPIDPQHIIAWYPLNGNANDYSGNSNQGTSYNVTWNANWQSGYSTPTS